MHESRHHQPNVRALGSPRTFDLVRLSDTGGVSGTGAVAEGVVFGDGTTVLRWLTDKRSTAIYACAKELLDIHGHGGETELRYHVSKGLDGRACSGCGHPMSDHWQDNAAICTCGGCTCCLMEHPEFKALGEPRDPRNFIGDATPQTDEAGRQHVHIAGDFLSTR